MLRKKSFSKDFYLLLALFIIAIIVRIIYLDSIYFTYDQSRDAFKALEIWTQDPIKIQGPNTDIPDLFHGPLYWYLISPVYFFFKGNVVAVRIFLVILNSLGVFLVYHLSESMFKKRNISLLAASLYAFSFEIVQYARWLSNPAPALLTITLSFLCLWKYLKGKDWGLPATLFFWGLSVQLEFFMVYQLLVFIIIWLVFKGFSFPRLKRKDIILSSIALILPFLSFVVSELKFDFKGLKALASFFTTQSLFGSSFIEITLSYIDQLVSTFFYNLMGLNLFFAGIIGIFIIYFSIKQINKNSKHKKPLIFLLIWTFSSLILQFFMGTNANFTNLGIGIAFILLFSAVANLALKNKNLPKFIFPIIVFVVIAGNLSLIFTHNKNSEVLFFIQDNMILKDEIKVIDWIYSDSQGEPFKINTITNPLFINTTWAYMFDWHGNRKYGYMPIWWGETQVDVPGHKVKFSDKQQTELFYLIIEPGPGIPKVYVTAIKSFEDERSKLIETKQIGALTVEKRKVIKDQVFTSANVFERLTQ